jgi:hypothetical protein
MIAGRRQAGKQSNPPETPQRNEKENEIMSLKCRIDGVISLTPAADYTAKLGYLVTHDGTTATLSASATTRANGVILEPNRTAAGYAAEKVTVGLLGAMAGTVRMCAGGVIAAGAWVQQDSDGQVLTDAAAGARVIVGQALEAATAAGDLIEVAPCSPLYIAA